MEDVFLKYMGERFKLDKITDITTEDLSTSAKGPVITISRQAGCSAELFARKLAEKLTIYNRERNRKFKWHWVNKEIINESADHLNIHPSKVKYVFKAEKRKPMDEFFGSMYSSYHKNEKAIIKGIIKVVKNIAARGNIIIVGRGGVVLTRDIKKTLHIKLIAPLEWRIDFISKKHQVNTQEAAEYINEVDKKRSQLIDNFMGKATDDSIFDMIINSRSFTNDEIIDVVMRSLISRRVI